VTSSDSGGPAAADRPKPLTDATGKSDSQEGGELAAAADGREYASWGFVIRSTRTVRLVPGAPNPASGLPAARRGTRGPWRAPVLFGGGATPGRPPAGAPRKPCAPSTGNWPNASCFRPDRGDQGVDTVTVSTVPLRRRPISKPLMGASAWTARLAQSTVGRAGEQWSRQRRATTPRIIREFPRRQCQVWGSESAPRRNREARVTKAGRAVCLAALVLRLARESAAFPRT